MTYLVLAIVVLVSVVQWRASTREARAETTWPPAGDFVRVNGVPVHYKIMGIGPDLVLIHGASGNMNDFTMGFVDRLTDRYRVILFDRPGLGYTGRPAGYGGAWNNREESPKRQARMLIEAADQIGLVKPIVMGHSFGGIVALAWGLRRPEKPPQLCWSARYQSHGPVSWVGPTA